MHMTILYEQCQWSTEACNFQFYFCEGMVGDRSKRKTCFWLSIYITLLFSEFRFSIVAVKERRIVKITWYWTAVGIQLWNSIFVVVGVVRSKWKSFHVFVLHLSVTIKLLITIIIVITVKSVSPLAIWPPSTHLTVQDQRKCIHKTSRICILRRPKPHTHRNTHARTHARTHTHAHARAHARTHTGAQKD